MDIFEPVRREVRALQSDLERREDDFHQLQRQTITDTHYMDLRGPYHTIANIEREIVKLRGQMPPYAVDHGTHIELLPVTAPINPREKV